MGFFSTISRVFVYTFEDFMAQGLVMKAIIGWGWLAVLIMAASLIDGFPALLAV